VAAAAAGAAASRSRSHRAEQTTPFLRTVVPHVERCKYLGDLVRWTDHEVVFERSVVSVEVDDLTRANRELRGLAKAIASAAAAIEPPFRLAIDPSAWRELARSLHGELCIGELSIAGELEGRPVEVYATYPTGPQSLPSMAGVYVSVGDPELAADAARELAYAVEHPAADAANAPPPLRALLAAWPDDFFDLEIANGVARAILLVPAPRAADAGRVRELAVALRALLAALDPVSGPYR
jgi:hypothetical protein